MSADLRELYQEMILDHGRHPRNFGKPPHSSHTAEGYNPLCGDKCTVYLDVDDNGTVHDAHFSGNGCAISTASASLMTEAVKGKSAEETAAIFERFHDVVTGKTDDEQALEDIGRLAVLAGVSKFPVRIKCATLPWHTLQAALRTSNEIVTTE
ncbi:MAG: Fe-S cluster assembly sulfur transfer protein SufU [Candidatus Sumerlaeaceae bacterium]